MIEIIDFHKAYGDFLAVAGLNCQVQPGEILGLIGPNGAGKTTTLRALAGICPPSRGRLSVAGYDVQGQPIEAKRRLAYVADDPQLFSDLTVEEHLRFFAEAYGVADAGVRIHALLTDFQLETKTRVLTRDLSRGMRQKLAICCAYLHDPIALLLDEPMTGLDPAGIRRLKQSIRERAARGAAIVVSSHLLAVVEDICTHVLILKDGTTQLTGSLDFVRQQLGGGRSAGSLEDLFFLATEPVAADTTPAVLG